MGQKSSIAWTEATWNPVRGCTRISEGCRFCYAELMAARYSGKGQPYEGVAEMTPSGPRWTGKLKVVEKHMDDPIRWKKPRIIFVNSMSDLFHEKLDWDVIKRVFDVMVKAPHHTFQVLTKRHEIMRNFVKQWLKDAWVSFEMLAQRNTKLSKLFRSTSDSTQWKSGPLREVPPHIWLGVSVEDQKSAADRIPALLDTPAATRFLSAEPLINPIDFRKVGPLFDHHISEVNPDRGCKLDAGPGGMRCINKKHYGKIDWIIVGGESGNGARPMAVDWARDIVRYCELHKIACFVKQMGTVWARQNKADNYKGEEPKEWPKDLRVRDYPTVEEWNW